MQDSVLILYSVNSDTACLESNAETVDEANAVARTLKLLGIEYNIESISSLGGLPEIFARNNHSIVFNLVEQLENIFDACYIPAFCRAFGRACTGNNTASLLLALNKYHAKLILQAANVPCPAGRIFAPGEEISDAGLEPDRYIIKPALADASEGIGPDSVIEIPSQSLKQLVNKVHNQFRQPAIVEQFIENREFNVSVFARNGKVRVLPIAEIDFKAFGKKQTRIVDYAAKWHKDSFVYNNTPRVIPAKLSISIEAKIRDLALRAWRALGCDDYTRVDFRMDIAERPFVIEVNPNPDICPDEGFAAAVAAEGLTYQQFIETVLTNAWKRLSREEICPSAK
ncbi:MAG: ATP-grasp domain-containing protein [Sedimentisphaerales bacterium]|nr:ATP-grasp domain-containing protein [Sedimentisphaerales bacterium]